MPYMRKYPEMVKVHKVNPDHRVKWDRKVHKENWDHKDLLVKMDKEVLQMAEQESEVTGDGTSGDPYIINNSQAGFEHYIGEIFGGGIIYYLWKDLQGIEHGLIINPNPLTNPNPVCLNYEFDPITGTYIEFLDSSRFESNGTASAPLGIIHDGHEISIWADNYFSGNSFTL